MNSVKMKPIVPVPKRAHGFSIDSIMGVDNEKDRHSNTSSDDSDPGEESRSALTPDEVHRPALGARIPPLHPSLPVHVQQLLLAGDPTGRANQEQLFALRQQAWAFGNQQLGNFPGVGANGAGFGVPPHISPGFHPGTGPIHPGLVPRDHLSMYPWLMARQAPSLMGFPYGHPDGLFFHPYRKPKRIRTAFSPTQLLKLEHAFEKNHYVVGQERKELASKLNLTETQVKVWFQNRRTKHKRVRSDDEDPESGNISIDDDDIHVATSSTECHVTSQQMYSQHNS